MFSLKKAFGFGSSSEGSSSKVISAPMVFLHGVLYLEVKAGKDLPDVDASWFRRAKDVSDPYVTVDTCVGGKRSCRIAKTSIIDDSLSPHWDEKYRIEMCHEVESFLFTVKDVDLLSVDCMGFMNIRAEDLVSEEVLEGWYPLSGNGGDMAGSLLISMQYRSVDSITRSQEVPDTVFPLRDSKCVRLYQDAHTPAVPPITDVTGVDGEPYSPPSLWVDIARYLEGAERLIYITGWSVKADIPLERGEGAEGVGELLKRKAEEGVRVLLLVWNELASSDYYNGVMGTHDEETRLYFEGSEVEVVLAPRSKNKGKLLETNFVSTCYTHHQKSVVVDADGGEDAPRRLVAFVGGLDLTDGRWDTPDHPLFSSLAMAHCNDFYNGVCASSATVGPRQPWHDIHMFVDGLAALDVHQNFTERWRCQAAGKEHRLVTVSEEEYDMSTEGDEGDWKCQLFRSINSDSANFDTNILDRLLMRKGRLFDNSIQRAYVHHIRRAKRFVFIENQYFLGSSHGWLSPDAKCNHLVPLEIVVRITGAIAKGEEFRAYIVIPLHPEGDPSTGPVQEILYWQWRTIQMMYKKIFDAIAEAELDAHPTDYLSFFCLGKRESPDEAPEELDAPDADTVAQKARQHMRFMIYVHSKMAILDDEYCIVGSANVNERSMNGNRDTEMAIGMFQPAHTKETMGDEPIVGAVGVFRQAVWAEHLGAHHVDHALPHTLECMRSMRALAQDNLERFLQDEPEHNDAHLLMYPVQVSAEGEVEAWPGCENFPDTQAPVLGAKSSFLPNSLTT